MTSEFPIIAPHVISMKDSQHHDERWLHDQLKDDPSLLGLKGDLNVLGYERPQPSGGRLDLLLSDPATKPETWYEVEIQLGAIDESHIIRTIEYWDIERKRYPKYAHIAVIVAEEVTSRFLNVIQLFNHTIDLIAIQIQLVEVNGSHTLIASRIVDLFERGTDEEDEGPLANRAYWEEKASPTTLKTVDEMVAYANEIVSDASGPYQPKYNLHDIVLSQGGPARKFMSFRPQKKHLVVMMTVKQDDQTQQILKESGLDPMSSYKADGRYHISLRPGDPETYKESLGNLIRRAHEQYRP